MECPSCRHLNSALSLRCEQCGTAFIRENVNRSEADRKGDAFEVGYMYRLIGGFLGYFVAFFLISGIARVSYSVDQRLVRL